MEYYKYLRQLVGHNPIILPGSVVIIVNNQNEVLLQKKHNENWGLPGGLMDLGESFEEVAKREVFEETGLIIENLYLLDVYSGTKYYLKLPNDDELYSATAVYYTTDVSGDIRIDYSESKDMKYFSLDNLPVDLTGTNKEFIEEYIHLRRDRETITTKSNNDNTVIERRLF